VAHLREATARIMWRASNGTAWGPDRPPRGADRSSRPRLDHKRVCRRLICRTWCDGNVANIPCRA